MAIERIETYMAVVETGSIQAAAKKLVTSRASVRRHLEEFEASLGVPLLERTQQGVRPTAAGQWLAEQGRALLTSADELFDSVRRLEQDPTGMLTLAIMPGLAVEPLSVACQMLMKRFPELDFTLTVRRDLLKALQSGDAQIASGFLPDEVPASYETLRLAEADVRLMASPAYLRAHGPIESPQELSRHALLCWAIDGRDPTLLPLRDGSFLRVKPRVVSNEVMMLRAAAALGTGVVYAPDSLARHLMAGPSLVRVLDDQVGHQQGIGLIVPSLMRAVPRIKAVWEVILGIASQRILPTAGGPPQEK